MAHTVDLVSFDNNVVRSRVLVQVDPEDSIPKAIFRSLTRNPDKDVMVDAASTRTWTGSLLFSAIGRAMHVWSDVIGLVEGERVAFYCPNSDWLAINMIAVSAIGAVFTAAADTHKYCLLSCSLSQ